MPGGAVRRGRGRTLLRLVIVLTAVISMTLAPVVTWPSSGAPPEHALPLGVPHRPPL